MSEKAFVAKPGDDICNDCVSYERCLELEKNMGGVPHDGARACKNFIKKPEEIKDPNPPPYVDDDKDDSWVKYPWQKYIK